MMFGTQRLVLFTVFSIALAGQDLTTVHSLPRPLQTKSAPRIKKAFTHSPLRFEPNMGQAAADVQYIGRGHRYRLLLTGDEVVMVMHAADGRAKHAPIRMKLFGASRASRATGGQP